MVPIFSYNFRTRLPQGDTRWIAWSTSQAAYVCAFNLIAAAGANFRLFLIRLGLTHFAFPALSLGTRDGSLGAHFKLILCLIKKN